MEHLPLFPLSMIFFPGFPIQLRIFEERYKEMIKYCINEEKDLGAVLIRSGKEALGPLAHPHQVGTLASIRHLKKLKDGGFFLEALGIGRFWIQNLNYEKSYLRARVQTRTIRASSEEEDHQAQALLPLVREYLQLLGQKSVFQTNLQLPCHACFLAYTSAHFLQIPQHRKQKILEIEETQDLVSYMITAYQEQIRLVKFMQKQKGMDLHCYN